MSKSKIFLYFCTSFVAGIFLSSFLEISDLIKLGIAFVLIILICLFWQDPEVKVIGFCGLIFLFGIWYCQRSQVKSSQIASYNDKNKITFQGIVVKEPDVRVNKTQLTVEVIQVIEKSEKSRQSLGKVLVILPRALQYQYGDKLELFGSLKTPKDDKGFSYKNYLARNDIYSICYYPEVKLIGSGYGNPVLRFLLAGKTKLKKSIDSILSEPQASFLKGMLLGEKKAMPKEVREWFNKCSTTHITVISGMHVSIVAALLMNLALALYLSRKQAFWFAVVGISLFVILTGAQASAVRAGIIGGLALLAIHSGRLSEIKNALLFTASLMLLINPRILKFDLGFQLSFLAVIGLVYLSPYLEKRLKFFPETFRIRDSASMTLSAQLMTLPLILFHFKRISLIAPLANILILPFIPLTMLLGFVSGILGLIWLFLGQITAWITWLFLTYELSLVKYLSKIPFASIEIKNIWIGWLIVYYLVLFSWIWWREKKKVGLSRKLN